MEPVEQNASVREGRVRVLNHVISISQGCAWVVQTPIFESYQRLHLRRDGG